MTCKVRRARRSRARRDTIFDLLKDFMKMVRSVKAEVNSRTS
jgi:hypothetical protein